MVWVRGSGTLVAKDEKTALLQSLSGAYLSLAVDEEQAEDLPEPGTVLFIAASGMVGFRPRLRHFDASGCMPLPSELPGDIIAYVSGYCEGRSNDGYWLLRTAHARCHIHVWSTQHFEEGETYTIWGAAWHEHGRFMVAHRARLLTGPAKPPTIGA